MDSPLPKLRSLVAYSYWPASVRENLSFWSSDDNIIGKLCASRIESVASAKPTALIPSQNQPLPSDHLLSALAWSFTLSQRKDENKSKYKVKIKLPSWLLTG